MNVVLYRLYDRTNRLLYVGISNNVIGRVGEHAASKDWFKDVYSATFEHCDSRERALKREAAVIQFEHPRHNIRKQLDLVKTGVCLTQRQLDRLQRRADAEGQTLSHYVRYAIEQVYPETTDEEQPREEAIA